MRLIWALTLAIGFFIPAALAGQQSLELQVCIEKATEANLQILGIHNAINGQEFRLLQSKAAFAPSVNGFMSLSRGIGTQVDNFTQAIAQSPTNISPGLSAQINLFKGFANWYNLKSSELNLASQGYSLERTLNDIRVNVTAAFMQCLYDQENLRISKERADLLGQQFEKAQKQFEAGVVTEGDVFSFQAQAAAAKVEMVNLDNFRMTNLLTLFQLLNETPASDFNYIVKAPATVESLPLVEIPTVEDLFSAATQTMPIIKEKRAKLDATEFALRAAKGNFYPSLSLSYQAGSFFSSNARERLGFDLNTFQVIYGNTIPLFDQLNNNFGQQVGINLSIPIFNGFQARGGVVTSQINNRSAQLDLEAAEQQLYRDVQRAILDFKSAQAKANALQDQLRFQEVAYRYAQSRFDAGLLDYYAYMESFNALDRAKRDLVQSKYDFLVKWKMVELYEGKELKF